MASTDSVLTPSAPSLTARIPWRYARLAAVLSGFVALGYGLTLSAEGADPPRFEFSSGLFSAAAFLYLLGFAGYLTHLARNRTFSGEASSVLTLEGAALHTAGMIVRWTLSGWSQPPWTNLYESLLFFAWGIVIVYLAFEWKSRSRVAGVFVIPTAVLFMGLAAFSLSGSKEIPQLMPALQSRWIQIHVTFASIAYAAFLVAFGFAILYLVKDRLSSDFMAALYAAFVAATFLGYGRGAVLKYAEFPLKTPKLIAGAMENVPVPVPWAGQFFLAALLLYAGVCACYFVSKKRGPLLRYVKPLLLGAFVVHTAGMIAAIFHAASARPIPMRPEITLFQWDINAYKIALVVLTWLGSAVLLLIYWRGAQLAETLPDKRLLDDWTYKAVIVGLPLMTLNLITGAVWANNAWGSYWSWDPKETWALITWLVYAAFIHTRIAAGWSGRKSAALAVVGFAVVIFTYLGVNLFLSGLHSYGSPG